MSLAPFFPYSVYSSICSYIIKLLSSLITYFMVGTGDNLLYKTFFFFLTKYTIYESQTLDKWVLGKDSMKMYGQHCSEKLILQA